MTTYLNNEPHTNNGLPGLDTQGDRIRSLINSALTECHSATEIAIDLPQTTVHQSFYKSQTIASESGVQENTDGAFNRESRADVIPTPPFTPPAKKTDEALLAVADNSNKESLPWLTPLTNGLSNLTIDLKDCSVKQDDSYFLPRLSSSPISSTTTEWLPILEEEPQECTPPITGKINIVDSHLDSCTAPSTPPIQSHVQSISTTDSGLSLPSPSAVDESCTTTPAMPTSSTAKINSYIEKGKRRTSSYEKFVPPPPGTFTSARARSLRSEVQARLVVHAQRKAHKEREEVLRNKYYPDAPSNTTPPVTKETQSTIKIPITVQPPPTAESPTKKKSRDTSKWSYSRQTSLFWHDSKRETFYPYSTLGVAELDCFGAGLMVQTMDTFTSSIEDRYPESRWKAQVELDKKKSSMNVREQEDAVDDRLGAIAGKTHVGVQTELEATSGVES